MKVQKIYVKNLRQIEEQKLDLNGCTAIITGGNNKGKSTILKSIIDRLRGNKSDILKKGEQSGECEWSFTDGSVLSWELHDDKEKITYITKEGIKTSAIKDICNMLFGKGFDIDVFLGSSPKDQKKIMQELVGLDFTDINNRYDIAYRERTEANAVYNSEKAKLSDLEYVDIKGEYVDISELQNNLIEQEKKNEQVNSIESKIKDREIRLKQLEDEIATIKEDIKKGNERLQENKKQDTEKLRQKISEQSEINTLHTHNKKVEEMKVMLGEAKKIADEKDKEVKSIDKERVDMYKSANMPQGFEFTDDGLSFNGFTLDKSHLSSSQTYIAGLMLASMNIGSVQALTFDASYLDKKSLEEIERWANDKGLQLLIERPDFEGGEIKYEIIN